MNEVSLNGDSHIEAIPTIKQKALRINLNENIYGTFAEIGAGQETVRQFLGSVVPLVQLPKQCLHMTKASVMIFMGLKMTKDM